MTTRHTLLASGLTLACVFIASCGPTPGQTATVTVDAQTLTLTPGETATVTIEAQTMTLTPLVEDATRTPLPPPISLEFPTGRFYHQHGSGLYCVYQFNPDGTSAYYWFVSSTDVTGDLPYVTSTYSVEGTLFHDLGTDQTECLYPATFTWTFDGEYLTFQVVGEDTCPDRQRTYETPLLYRLAACGNATVEAPEECDDGNTVDGDGCSSTCQNE